MIDEALPFSTRQPSLYVSEGFVEAMPNYEVTELESNKAELDKMRVLALAVSTIPSLGGMALSTPKENGKRTAYHYVESPEGLLTPRQPLTHTYSWTYIHDAAYARSVDVLRVQKTMPTEPEISGAVYDAMTSYRGYGIRPTAQEVFGTVSGFGIGLAVTVIQSDILYGRYTQAAEKVVAGTVVGATAISSLLKNGKALHDKPAVQALRPVIVR